MVSSLQRCETFEPAAAVALAPMLQAVAASLTASRFATSSRLLRGSVHLRSSDTYRAVTTLLANGEAVPAERAPMTSATIWRLVHKSGAFVAADLEAMAGTDTHMALADRDTTHVCAVPLRGPRGVIAGMFAFEASCPAAVGLNFDGWAAAQEALLLLADVAAPFLRDLPVHRDVAPPTDALLPVIGSSTSALYRMLTCFARLEDTVVLRGPTGVGKSRLGAWVHARSGRATGPYVVAQLHSHADTLREGALFGWKKGAFTGAATDRDGLVASAEGGTLFLDEIDKMSLDAQGRLLRLLEDRRYTRVGEDRERFADVRFIVGTNVDLSRAVEEGRFLEDLYYRVCVLPVDVPALDDRRDEIGAWARHMLDEVARASDTRAALAPDAVTALTEARWPGNLRQLNSVVKRAYALATLDGAPAGHLTIGAAPVHAALAMESRGKAPPPAQRGPARPSESLRAAASAFVDYALQQRTLGKPPLSLDLADALRGAILTEAARRTDEREAFLLFGLDKLVEGRNHLKALRREEQRLAEFDSSTLGG
jgi:transcriptional regulator with AAA-type ATPase domain